MAQDASIEPKPLGEKPPEGVEAASKPGDGKPDEKGTPSEVAAVKLWLGRIKDAKAHWKDAFEQIKQDQEFAAGYQWADQKSLQDKRYVANVTLRHLREKEAALYARDPKVEFVRRRRMDFALWDGKPETLMQAGQAVAQATMLMQPPAPQAVALLTDYQHGVNQQLVASRIGETLEIVYQWMVDELEPDFKQQFKAAVLCALTGGVAWVRVGFERNLTSSLASLDSSSKFGDRAKRAERIVGQLDDDKVGEDSADMQQLNELVAGMAQGVAAGEMQDITERLVFDFPTATSIIVDKKCRCLKTFDGARWIAQEHIMALSEANEFFETDIDGVSSEITHYTDGGLAIETKPEDGGAKDPLKGPTVCIYEVFDYRTKSTFFVADGYKYYIQKPAPVEPATRRFWPVFGLVFNKVIADPGQKVTCYPPSDVRLMRSAQKEWNRSRQALHVHRVANAPKYPIRKGWLNEEDLDRVQNSEDNEVIEFEGLPANMNPADVFKPMQHAAIDPSLYETQSLEQDIQLAAGSQQADLGAPKGDVTATASSISEHAKQSTTADNVDDLDGVLDGIARMGGEILLREMTQENVMRIAGPGAVWPEENRQDYLNEIVLQAKAASSGRPNKALEVSNWQVLAPLILQAGGNPQGVVKETARRLDDQMDVGQFFPLTPPASPGAAGQLPRKGTAKPPTGGPAPAKQGNPLGNGGRAPA